MASRRVAKSSVDWAKLQKLLPQDQQAVYTNLLAKNFQYTSKLASLPENLPKIDFENYKKQLANPSLIEKLEKSYLAFQVPYPKDSENALSKIEQQEKQEDAALAQFLKDVSSKIESLKSEKFKLTNIPPLEEMTRELEVYYFPEKRLEAQFEKEATKKDAYIQLLEYKKHGGHSHH